MSDPFAGGFDPRMFENVPLFRELAKVMSWRGGPVNWEIAQQTALAIAAPGRELPASDRDSAEFAEAVGVAELWLDQVTALPACDGPARALGAGEWTRLATTSEGLGVYVEPVAEGMSGALAKDLPEEMRGMLGGDAAEGPMGQALGAVSAMLYGVQVGTIAGNLAGQLLGCYDLGVPTVDARITGTVAGNLTRFAKDYGFEPTELRYWLALREAAQRRVFVGVGWLRSHLTDLIRRFAADAEFDPVAMMETLRGFGIDTPPEAIEELLQQPDAFRVEPTTAQRRTLSRLQALVAFVEGWNETVVRAAAQQRLPALPRVEETMRRRRAEKGPGERFLQQLIGLDLTPADVRQGGRFCAAVIAARGQEGLDRAWQRAGCLPRPEELAEPSRWLVRMAAAELETGEE